MSEEKYYFITYEWSGNNTLKVKNTVTNRHPVFWLREVTESAFGRHTIMFWEEIEKEHFDALIDLVD